MVQGKQAGEDLLRGQRVGPAIGGEDGAVEGLVGVFEPGALASGAQGNVAVWRPWCRRLLSY
jgi:hypothetical protein